VTSGDKSFSSPKGTDRPALLLVLHDLIPVVVSRGHIPDPIDLLAIEDHDPLAPLLVEEDGFRRVVDLGDGGIRAGAEEGAEVFKGHGHRLSRA
jgi:hypothetical protein